MVDIAQFCRLARVCPPIQQEIGFVYAFIRVSKRTPRNQMFFEARISEHLPAGEEKTTIGAECGTDRGKQLLVQFRTRKVMERSK